MGVVHAFEVILGLLAAVIVLELMARRLGLPPAGALILGGIGLALVPGLPLVELDPDLALVLFLPPLLQAGAYVTAWRDFRANLRIILQLAVGAVVFTTAMVGVVAHAVMPGLPWAACFALGAIVSPPDAVAAASVLAHVRMPRRLVTLLEGESLVNDASGLVLFRFSVAAALTGTFSLADAAGSFVLLSVGGVIAGVVFGNVGARLLERLRDAKLITLGSFLVGWGAYIGAEAISVSGVLSTVACGLIMGWRQHATLGAEARVAARACWQFVEYVLQSLVFILIGLSLRGVLERLGGSIGDLAFVGPVAVVVAAVIVSRFLWVVPTTYLVRALIPPLRRRDPYPPLSIPIVISWAGMRGVVSLAAALALPSHFPGRDFILAATFAVILVTVLVQGATLAPLIAVLKLDRFDGPGAATLGEAVARAQMIKAQLAAMRRVSAAADGSELHPRLVEQFLFRAEAAERFSEQEAALLPGRREHFSALLAAVEGGRAELVRMHRKGEIHDSTLHALEGELDLEELAARQFADDAG